MTRLFIRFFLGVVGILVVAWLTQGFVVYRGNVERNTDVVREALFGGFRTARDQLAGANAGEFEMTLQNIKSNFDYPVEVKAMDEFETKSWLKPRLVKGDPVFINQNKFAISFDDNRKVLSFGPLPQWVAPSQSAMTLGLGTVLLLSAAAIAFLLRPIVEQFRSVERTATAIAEGDLSARIESRGYSSSVPIASAFNSMANRTETLLKSQRELLQAVSHELRTPLARIQFATDLLETDDSDEARKGRIAPIDNATQESDSLVGELLSYVRLESESNDSRLETLNIGELFEHVVEARSSLHEHISFSVKDSMGIHVEADRVSLVRAIGNLVSNAAKHAKSQVVLSANYLNSNHVSITVDDDGEGINERDCEAVFEPFVRLENGSGNGVGLGLALVKRIASRHSGSVSVQRNESGGACFMLVLPKKGTQITSKS